MTSPKEPQNNGSIPEDYQLVNNEYVKKSHLLTSEEVECIAEIDIVPFFGSLGINVKRVSRTKIRTVDYEYENVGLEVTVVQDYLPKHNEIDKLLDHHIQTNSRICAYMYMKGDKPRIEIMSEKNLDKLAILCLRQHISCYRSKIIGKISKKYNQDQEHDLSIIILDFRLAPFDSLSLKWEVRSILDSCAKDYYSLGGVLIASPKELDSTMVDEPDYVFVNNIYCKKQHEILTKLNRFSLATTSTWNTVTHIFVKQSPPTSISSPCFDCPEREELEIKRLPTFMMNSI